MLRIWLKYLQWSLDQLHIKVFTEVGLWDAIPLSMITLRITELFILEWTYVCENDLFHITGLCVYYEYIYSIYSYICSYVYIVMYI